MKKKTKPAAAAHKKPLYLSIIPGIRGKLSIITGLFVTLILLSATFFNYIHEGRILEESFTRETESSLKYIRTIVSDMDNVRNNILLVENMRLRIEEKQRDLSRYRYWYYRKNDSFANKLRSFGKSLGMDLRYEYRLASANTYYSIYLSESQIKGIEKSIQSRLRTADGAAISDAEFRTLQDKARWVAAYNKRIDAYEQTAAENESKITEMKEADEKKNKADIANLRKQNSYYDTLIKNESRKRQYSDRIFRAQLKNYYEYEFGRMEDMGLQSGSIRIITYERRGEPTYDTGSYSRDALARFADLTGSQQYIKDRDGYFTSADTVPALKRRADFDYRIGKNSFHAQYLPVYRNPPTFQRVDAILAGMEKYPADWKAFLKEDTVCAEKFAQLIPKMKARLAVLKKENIPTGKDREYASLYAEYKDITAAREKAFNDLNPYNGEYAKIYDYYTRKIEALNAEIDVANKKIAAVKKNAKADDDRAEEIERIKGSIAEIKTQISLLQEDLRTNRDDIGRSEKRTAQDAFHYLRDAALYDFAVLRQKKDPKAHSEYLKTPGIRTVETKRWQAIRSWIATGNSETDLPENLYGSRIPVIDGGILAYSRSEAEEYMWKLDSTPLADDIGFFSIDADKTGLLGELLSRNEMGYSAVIIDKTEGLAKINENRRIMILISVIIALCAVLMTWFLSGFIVRRIQSISIQAAKTRGGDLSVNFPETGMDEIAEMGVSLNAMIKGLREREELKGELAAAGEIQKQLLPENVPDTLGDGYSIGRFYVSMLGVGGDYYDFIELDKDRLFFCIGDVSNHGVGPAIVMAVLRADIHGIIKSGERDLSKILLDLNRRLFLETPPHIFVTFFAGIIDKTSHEVTYCSAGHLKAAVYRHKSESVERLQGGGLPLGMDDNDIFTDTITLRTTTMKPGDLFFQFTDGMSEAMDTGRNIFSEERLMAAVKNSARKKMDLFIKNVASSVQDFTGKDMFALSGMTDLNDDCAMVAFKRLK